MKKPSFKQWKEHYVDVPFIKENYDLLESMEVPIECISGGINFGNIPPKFIRVFTFGSWYEILENGNHYLLLGNEDYMGEEEEVIKTIKRELYDWASEELTNFGE